jgi:glycosyltransferase involved in cell wall biosynthesis
MLCRTPVIGSGSGGMLELLKGGGQTVCHSFTDLIDLTRKVLNDKERYGHQGYTFAKQFDTDYFYQRWVSLIRNLT